MDGFTDLEAGLAVGVVVEDGDNLLCGLVGGVAQRLEKPRPWCTSWSDDGMRVEAWRSGDHGGDGEAVGHRRFVLFE